MAEPMNEQRLRQARHDLQQYGHTSGPNQHRLLAEVDRLRAASDRVTGGQMRARLQSYFADTIAADHDVDDYMAERVFDLIREVAADEQAEARHYSDSLSEGGEHDGPGWAQAEGDDR